MKTIFLPLAIVYTVALLGQAPLPIAATHYGLDSSRMMLLIQANESALTKAENGLVTPDDFYLFLDLDTSLLYDSSYQVSGVNGDTFTVSFTPLPLVKITSDGSINRYNRRPSVLTYARDEEVLTSPVGVRYRGGFSLRFPKKSIDLEFYETSANENTRDVSFGDMRSDDDWVIDALYNEPSRVNAYVAHKLWLDLHQLSYADEEPEAKAGADLEFVELWLNGKYQGLCTLGEQVDRKLLKLKKLKDDEVRGLLFKSEDYTDATSLKAVPADRIKGDKWAGWEVKHPEPDEVEWEELKDFIRFSGSATNSEFQQEAARRIDLANVIDYLLFVNALSLTDNVSKNTFLGRYDESSPFFFVPWDMDAGIGTNHEGKRYSSFDHFSENFLFRRLREQYPDDFTDQLCDRYENLREGLLHPDSLIARVTNAMATLEESGAFRREAARWPATLNSSSEQLDFMASVLRARIDKLDSYVCSLPTSIGKPDGQVATALKIFPNPAGSYVTISLPAGDNDATYILFGSTGQAVRSGAVRGEHQDISLDGLATGLYYLRVGKRVARLTVAR
ncbi:MAG: CotH kinase family protein [Lewinella sp.]